MQRPPAPASGLKDPNTAPRLSDAQLSERIAQDQRELAERLRRARSNANEASGPLRKVTG